MSSEYLCWLCCWTRNHFYWQQNWCSFSPKKVQYKQPAPSNVFLNGVRAKVFDQVKYLGVWINASLKDDDDIQREVKSLYCAANKLRDTFDQCSPAVKNTPIACRCMLAIYGANTRRPVWSACVLHITMLIELCITYPEMLVLAHTRLAIVSGPLMPCWEKTCIEFLGDAHLHPTFLFDRFKCLMLFTNLHFSSIIQRSCMVETKCSRCPGIVSILRLSPVLLLCNKNMWTLCTHQHKKK